MENFRFTGREIGRRKECERDTSEKSEKERWVVGEGKRAQGSRTSKITGPRVRSVGKTTRRWGCDGEEGGTFSISRGRVQGKLSQRDPFGRNLEGQERPQNLPKERWARNEGKKQRRAEVCR